jgi:ferredoxin-NADP reductase
MERNIKIKAIENLTHDVKRFQCEKPPGYTFIPGQATDLAINKKGWREEKRAFSFTSTGESQDLEFIIKIYPDHPGVTRELDSLKKGDELLLDEVWGAIAYKGPGYFIAGGAGITPFIAILRQLHRENKLAGNKLFFSNKTRKDIILEAELSAMLGPDAVYTITDEPGKQYHNGYIDERFLDTHIADFSKPLYLCGPPRMVEALQHTLIKLGASPEAVVFEK